MIDPQPGDRVRMTLIGTFGYDRHNRSPILTVRNDATGAIYEVPVHVEAAFTRAEASAAALAEAIRDANIGWDEMQNSVTAETWPGTWDEWVADALIEAGFIATPPAETLAEREMREVVTPLIDARDTAQRSAERFRVERDLALWLHAEAVWKREEAHRHWRNMQAHISQRIAKPGCVSALRAQQQDMVRLPADARGEIERLLTANVGKPAGGVAHKLMLLLTSDSWRASRAPTEDQAAGCCSGEQCNGPRETCQAFPAEPAESSGTREPRVFPPDSPQPDDVTLVDGSNGVRFRAIGNPGVLRSWVALEDRGGTGDLYTWWAMNASGSPDGPLTLTEVLDEEGDR